jgi:hypothetical protein
MQEEKEEKTSKIILNKDGMKFVKHSNNTFHLSFSLENQYINVPAIINFELIKLIYDLNPDIYEKVILKKNSEEEAIVTLLMRHFFVDLGLRQKYSHVIMRKKTIINENDNNSLQIQFSTTTIHTSEKQEIIPDDAELVQIENLQIVVDCVSSSRCVFNCLILFNKQFNMPPFMEKMIGVIINKVFNRGKQFIENIR